MAGLPRPKLNAGRPFGLAVGNALASRPMYFSTVPAGARPFDFNTAAAQLPKMAQQASAVQAAGLPSPAPQPVAMAPPLPFDPSSAAQPVGSVAYQQQVYNNARRQVLGQAAQPWLDAISQSQENARMSRPPGLPAPPTAQPSGPTGVPSGMESQLFRGMGGMYGANDAPAGGFRMGPRVGTEGLGALPNYDAMNQVANAQHRADYEKFMDAAKLAGGSYAQGWNPKTNQNEKKKLTSNDTQSSEYAIAQNAERHKRLGDEKRLAQRSAVYGRANGLPPAAATAGIQGMDALAANPSYSPTDIQRMGMGLPPVQQPELSPEFVAWSNARMAYLNSDLPPESMAAAIGAQPPVYMTPGMMPAGGGLPKPAAQPGVAPGLTEQERQAQIAAQGAGDTVKATQIAAKREAIEELRVGGKLPADIIAALETADAGTARNLLVAYLGDTDETNAIWQRIFGTKGDDFKPSAQEKGNRPTLKAPFYGFMPVN